MVSAQGPFLFQKSPPSPVPLCFLCLGLPDFAAALLPLARWEPKWPRQQWGQLALVASLGLGGNTGWEEALAEPQKPWAGLRMCWSPSPGASSFRIPSLAPGGGHECPLGPAGTKTGSPEVTGECCGCTDEPGPALLFSCSSGAMPDIWQGLGQEKPARVWGRGGGESLQPSTEIDQKSRHA